MSIPRLGNARLSFIIIYRINTTVNTIFRNLIQTFSRCLRTPAVFSAVSTVLGAWDCPATGRIGVRIMENNEMHLIESYGGTAPPGSAGLRPLRGCCAPLLSLARDRCEKSARHPHPSSGVPVPLFTNKKKREPQPAQAPCPCRLPCARQMREKCPAPPSSLRRLRPSPYQQNETRTTTNTTPLPVPSPLRGPDARKVPGTPILSPASPPLSLPTKRNENHNQRKPPAQPVPTSSE
jgi:hypothetical protein